MIEKLVRRIEKMETAIEPRFQQHFVEAMAIPHKTAAYPNLRKARRVAGTEGVREPERDARPAAARADPSGRLEAPRATHRTGSPLASRRSHFPYRRRLAVRP